TASLGGTLDLSRINNFALAAGQTFTILTAATVTGTFATVNITNFPFGLGANVTYSATNVVVHIIELPCAIQCPSNITVDNDPNLCSAIVNYPAPTAGASCGAVTCVPASGSSFLLGTTTIHCSTAAGPSCMFTVTVNDSQAPGVTCPASKTGTAGSDGHAAVP